MGGTDQACELLRFWHAVEMFSPPEIPKTSTRRSAPLVVDVAERGPAPWQEEHPLWRERPLPPGKTKTWQFTVYGGLFEIDRVRAELVRVFGADREEPDGRRSGTTAMFAFTLDADGCLIEGSPSLSACAWAMGRLRSLGPRKSQWLTGFEDEEREFVTELNELSPARIAQGEAARSGVAAELGQRARSAAAEGLRKGVGAAATAAATAAGTALGGPVVGGIAGTAAGAFAEKLLARRESEQDGSREAEDPTLVVTIADVYELVKKLGDALGITEMLAVGGVRVRCSQVPTRSADEPPDQDFLNSFIAHDLVRVEKAVRGNDMGTALREFLSGGTPARPRVDVRAQPEAVVAGTAPARAPGGRWPSGAGRSLVLSQQFAVNQATAELGDAAGVFAVNGPPGTGKTTMLRDVLAAIVTSRAMRLAELDQPGSAFTGAPETVSVGKYRYTVRGLRPDLTGFEIVVATASNDAAANITAEVPSLDAVKDVRDEAVAVDYFTELATQVLDRPAWGLIAAVLGNMGNRSEFVSRFWWGDGVRARFDAADDHAEPVNSGMREVLARAAREPAPDWEDAVTTFRKTYDEVRRLADERQRVADAVTELHRLRTVLDTAGERIAAAERDHALWRDRHALAETARRRAETAVAEADTRIDRHHARKPGFWVSLSTWFRAGREWQARNKELETDLETEQRELVRHQQAVSHCAAEWERAAATGRELVRAHAEAVENHSRVEIFVADACERWPGAVPYGEAMADPLRSQLCAPWADPEFTTARHRLFLEALRLHKAFILGAHAQLRGNLGIAMAVLRNEPDTNPSPTALTAAWQSLFLVVPMVSTTFASLPRLLEGLGAEALGWLFIDEAGQAAPQQAVGGLWRTRRAVIVGDPRQLEPIVSLPLSAQQSLLRHHRLPERWTPDFTSAQRVADQLAAYGTHLPEPDGDETVWVGAPLRVHRRCDRPMFGISNQIAYGGDLMVFGTPPRADFPGENAWFDVRSEISEGKWIPAEGDQLRILLERLTGEAGIAPDDIRIISPFRDVVRGAKTVAQETLGWEFARRNVGTIHTVQGQEAEVVIVVLGTAPRQGGARTWAAEKPNLLNVAVSRAKRRLYVIGNHELWRGQRYFSVLAGALPRR